MAGPINPGTATPGPVLRSKYPPQIAHRGVTAGPAGGGLERGGQPTQQQSGAGSGRPAELLGRLLGSVPTLGNTGQKPAAAHNDSRHTAGARAADRPGRSMDGQWECEDYRSLQ